MPHPEVASVTDNELDAYTRHHNEMLSPLMEKALSGYHRDVVNAMLFMFCKSPDTIDEFGEYTHRYDSVSCNMYIWNYKSKIWECYEEQPGKLGGSPREKYFDFLIERIYKARDVLAAQVHKSTDDAFKANGDLTIKRMTKLIGSLSTVSYMDSVWKLFINKVKMSSRSSEQSNDSSLLSGRNSCRLLNQRNCRHLDIYDRLVNGG